jgi:hypothetical protein
VLKHHTVSFFFGHHSGAAGEEAPLSVSSPHRALVQESALHTAISSPSLSCIVYLYYFISPPSPPPLIFSLSPPLPSYDSPPPCLLRCFAPALRLVAFPLPAPSPPPPFRHRTSRGRAPSPRGPKKKTEGGKPGGTATRRACHSLEVRRQMFLLTHFTSTRSLLFRRFSWPHGGGVLASGGGRFSGSWDPGGRQRPICGVWQCGSWVAVVSVGHWGSGATARLDFERFVRARAWIYAPATSRLRFAASPTEPESPPFIQTPSTATAHRFRSTVLSPATAPLMQSCFPSLDWGLGCTGSPCGFSFVK